jgi:hypothetical protein
MSDDMRETAARRGNFLQTLRAVGWSFFGIRKSSGYQSDGETLNPVYVIIAGILGACLFVGALVLLVNWVVGSGVAQG